MRRQDRRETSMSLRRIPLCLLLIAGSCSEPPVTVANFDLLAPKLPSPITLDCLGSIDPQTGACSGEGTFDLTRLRVALPVTACAPGETPCASPGVPSGCTACDS